MGREIIGPWLAMKAMLEGLKVKQPVIIDGGAHFGNVTEYFLRMFDQCHVHAFEPEPAALAKLAARFDGEERVSVVDRALAEKRAYRRQRLYVGGQSGEMSSLVQRPPETQRRYYRHTLDESVLVEVDSIDQYCEEQGIEQVHIVKLDIQGTELEALKGASNLLTSEAIQLIYTEILFVPMYDAEVSAFSTWEFMRSMGYELFDIYHIGRSLVNRRIKYADALFVSPQVVEKVLNQFPDEWLPKSRDEALGEPSW